MTEPGTSKADRVLRVGLIGCGEIAQAHARAVAEAENATLTYAMDVNAEAARDIAGRYRSPASTKVEDVLASPEVDAVYISAPHHLHAPLGLQALRAGKHVMVEKPIATRLADADQMVREAARHNRLLSVCFVSRFATISELARDAIARGEIGEIVWVEINDMHLKQPSYWERGVSGKARPTNWRGDKDRAGGGVLIMNSVHPIDLVRYLTGIEVERVYAEYDTFLHPVEVEDAIAVILRYSNGALGTIQAATAAVAGREGRAPLRLFGTKGQIALGAPWAGKPAMSIFTLERNAWEHRDPSPGKDARTRYVEHFARACFGEEELRATGRDGYRALEVILAAYQAGASHRVITLSEL
jgi:predicted dehydrogenase